jgi:hypothetical protein
MKRTTPHEGATLLVIPEQVMDNLAWVAILQTIPADKLNQFTVVITGNTEITLQSVLRLDREFAVLKGRLSGSQDAGRVFFVPYGHMINLGTLYPIKDEEYEAIFGNLLIPDNAPAPLLAAPVLAPTPEPVAVYGSNGHHGPNGFHGEPQPDSGVRASIRSEVLERFRSRPNGPASSPNLPNPRQG